MITLYQIEYTDEMVDYLNGPEGGWSNAIKKYELIEADQELRLGADRWEPRFWKHFRAVAEIITDDLDTAWGIGNGSHAGMIEAGKMKPLLPMRKGRRNGKMYYDMHSMSVGNICQRGEEYFLCDIFGWKKVEID